MVKLFLGVRPKPCATIAARGLAPLARGGYRSGNSSNSLPRDSEMNEA